MLAQSINIRTFDSVVERLQHAHDKYHRGYNRILLAKWATLASSPAAASYVQNGHLPTWYLGLERDIATMGPPPPLPLPSRFLPAPLCTSASPPEIPVDGLGTPGLSTGTVARPSPFPAHQPRVRAKVQVTVFKCQHSLTNQ